MKPIFDTDFWSWHLMLTMNLMFEVGVWSYSLTMPLMSLKLFAAAKDSWACFLSKSSTANLISVIQILLTYILFWPTVFRRSVDQSVSQMRFFNFQKLKKIYLNAVKICIPWWGYSLKQSQSSGPSIDNCIFSTWSSINLFIS